MELEEMKSVWEEMSRDLERHKRLTNEIIIEMAHKKSSLRVKTIMYAESFGVLISLAGVVYLLLNFKSLSYDFSTYAGVGLVLIFIISVILGVRIVLQAKGINIVEYTYLQVLENFNRLKTTLRFYKRLSQWLYVVIPFLMLPVFSDLFLDKNILEDAGEMVETLIACAIVLPLIWWLFKKFYQFNMKGMSKAIKDYSKTENEK